MLGTFFKPEFINVNLESSNKDELFEEMVEQFVRGGAEIDRESVLDALFERESKMTTGIMPKIAIPHAVCAGIEHDMCSIGISRNGIEYGSLDGNPVHIIFMLLFCEGETSNHLEVMQELSLILNNADFCQKLLGLTSAHDVYEAICKAEKELA